MIAPISYHAIIELILFLLALYGIITLAVQNTRLVTEVDLTIGGWFLSKKHPILHRFFWMMTELGEYKVIKIAALITVTGLFIFGDWFRAIMVLVLVAAATIFNRYLKRIFPRIRPNFPQNYLYTVDLSFPSGHTMLATAYYGMLAYLLWIYGQGTILAWVSILVLGIIIVLIGLSRVYLGVHFLTDVVGGWIAGSVMILIVLLAGNSLLTLFHLA
jgi:undecaprenyl-diphosphatase